MRTIRTLLLVTLALCLASLASFAQGVGDPVTPSTTPADPPDHPLPVMTVNSPAQHATGLPDVGSYDILVNAFIDSFARVTVYDNWITFSTTNMQPTLGSFTTPTAVIADAHAPVAGIDLHGVVKDVAGARIDTNCRLNMQIDMGGHLTRIDDAGNLFAGVDTRRTDNGNYMLATQYKIIFKGKFLRWEDGDFFGNEDTAPAATAPGTKLVSPTSGEDTDYNKLTKWSTGAAGDIVTNTGWLWPVDDDAFPWTGGSYATAPANADDYTKLKTITSVVERGQSLFGHGGTEAAEFWIAERVLRRGLQDISGNYRQDIFVSLYYRESPVEWDPTL